MQQIHPYSYNSNGITYPTALDLSGNLVSAVAAPKQARYTCLECEVNMAVCRGEVKRPHFRHLSESNVERLCNPESYIHKLAKRLLKEKLDLALRENTPFILKWRCTDCQKDFSVNLTDYIDQVEVEQSLFNGVARPDLTLFKDGKPVIALEVVNTHAPEEKTLRLCEDNDVKVFVISVSPQDNLVDDWADSRIDGKWVMPDGWVSHYYDEYDQKDSRYRDRVFDKTPVYFFDHIDNPASLPLCWKCTGKGYEKKRIEETFSFCKKLKEWDGKTQILVFHRTQYDLDHYCGVVLPKTLHEEKFTGQAHFNLFAKIIPLFAILECKENDLLSWMNSFDYRALPPCTKEEIFGREFEYDTNKQLFRFYFYMEFSSPFDLMSFLCNESNFYKIFEEGGRFDNPEYEDHIHKLKRITARY